MLLGKRTEYHDIALIKECLATVTPLCDLLAGHLQRGQ